MEKLSILHLDVAIEVTMNEIKISLKKITLSSDNRTCKNPNSHHIVGIDQTYSSTRLNVTA